MEIPDLPLDWTRVSRKRSACCVDGSSGRRCRHTASNGTAGVDDDDDPLVTKRVHKGQVVVCLHESNPDWFQAYFFVDGGQVWGLLGTQKVIDECLQCTEGGYRVIDLKLTSSSSSSSPSNHTFSNIEWTGGDMMDLKGTNISMQADKIMTESTAVPILEKLFSGLLRRVKAETVGDDEEDDDDVEEPMMDALDLFPELAIVVGHMEMRLPIVVDKDDDDLFGDES